MNTVDESNPRPVRIRLYSPTDRRMRRAPVGHWYLRPDPQKLKQQAWRLSFWYPGFDWAGRRRLDGLGWDQASATFASTFYDLALPTHRQYRETIANLEKHKDLPGYFRPGFRPGATRKFLSGARREEQQWRAHMQEIAERYLRFIVDHGWPAAILPAWPWE